MKSITPEKNQAEVAEVGGTDFGFAYGTAARFRVSVFRQRGAITMVLRLIPNKLLTFEQIGIPPICRELVRRPRGLFLVTGPTGSGKSTTLATMIDYINTDFDRHIVTVEDPIEYYHYHKKSVVNQRQVGDDVPTFSEALRRVLRSDPDVILVGEMRDLETIEAAIRAAETGHLVFGTLHTTGASGTINRIIDAFPVSQQAQVRVQLSTSLIAVLSQALLPTIDRPGRVAAYEFLVVTPAIANLIRENKTFRIDSAIQTGKKFGMQLLDDHLWQLWEGGRISPEEAADKSRDPGAMSSKFRSRGIATGRQELDEKSEAVE
jgi:twitching motility protein PilT